MHLLAITALLLRHPQLDEWKPRVFPGGYSVDSPVSLYSMQLPDIEAAEPIKGFSWLGMRGSTGLLACLYTTKKKLARPDEPITDYLMGVVGSNRDGKIVSARDLIWRGWPGVEIEIRTRWGVWEKSRVYAIGNTVFSTIASQRRGLSSDGQRFIESMVIPVKAGSGPLKRPGPEMKTHELQGAGISVQMPCEPKRTIQEFGPTEERAKVSYFDAPYCDREFMCIYVPIPEEAADEAQQFGKEILTMLNDEFMGGGYFKNRKDTFLQRGNDLVMRTTATAPSGMAMQLETFTHERRLYCLVVTTPNVPNRVDEARAYFDSARIKD